MAGFISSQRTEHGVPHAVTCRALQVSESWYYKWRDRQPTQAQQRRVELDDKIRQIFAASGGTYGSPRVTLDLQAAGWRVGENTVARRMAALGLAGRAPKRRRNLTRQGKRPAAPDRVRRQFTAPAPDVLWCGDMTEIVTGEGKLYLATVIDLFSRRLLGYAMSAHHDAELIEASLHMAAATRGGTVDGVIFHSDRGSEYTSVIPPSGPPSVWTRRAGGPRRRVADAARRPARTPRRPAATGREAQSEGARERPPPSSGSNVFGSPTLSPTPVSDRSYGSAARPAPVPAPDSVSLRSSGRPLSSGSLIRR